MKADVEVGRVLQPDGLQDVAHEQRAARDDGRSRRPHGGNGTRPASANASSAAAPQPNRTARNAVGLAIVDRIAHDDERRAEEQRGDEHAERGARVRVNPKNRLVIGTRRSRPNALSVMRGPSGL